MSQSERARFPALFTPFRIGDIAVKNRIVMAPLTRNRATRGNDAPNALNVEYYRQRAGAGLIITEGTQISQQGQGYVWTPGIYSQAQIAGWKAVTDAVHAEGGKIIAQLWHVGRVSHVSLQPGNQPPVAPSPIQADTKTYIESGFAPVSHPARARARRDPGHHRRLRRGGARTPRPPASTASSCTAPMATCIDQFLRDGSNTRSDAYGGPIENRVRFALELIDAVAKVFPKGPRRHPHLAGEPGERRARQQSAGAVRPSRREAQPGRHRLHPCRRGRDARSARLSALRLCAAAQGLQGRLYRQ